MKRKWRILILTGITCILLGSFIVIRHATRKNSPITGKVIKEIARRQGFDLDNPSLYHLQVERKYNALPWEERRNLFMVLLDEPLVEQARKVLFAALEREDRETVIREYAELIRCYRQGMPGEEQQELINKLKSEEGRQMAENARRYYFQRLTPEERKELHPLIEEIVRTLEKVKG